MPPNLVNHQRVERGQEPLFSLVASRVLKDERTLNLRGVSEFKTYAELVKEAGIVKLEVCMLLCTTVRTGDSSHGFDVGHTVS